MDYEAIRRLMLIGGEMRVYVRSRRRSVLSKWMLLIVSLSIFICINTTQVGSEAIPYFSAEAVNIDVKRKMGVTTVDNNSDKIIIVPHNAVREPIEINTDVATTLPTDSVSEMYSGSGSHFENQTLTDPPEAETHGVPTNPTLVTAVAFDGRAEVSWKIPDDDGSDPITAYEVAWFDEQDGKLLGTQVVAHLPGSLVSSKDLSTPLPNRTANVSALVPTTTIISPLTNGRSTSFKVRAQNKNGFSTWSAKSLPVSPLHPPDLCGRITCSGHGTCFPYYSTNPTSDLLHDANQKDVGKCLCHPGFNPPDCSVLTPVPLYIWKTSEWGECSSGCGGGKRTRDAMCWDVLNNKRATDDSMCLDKKPSLTRICNGMECGSKLVSIVYKVEMSFDEVFFSTESYEAFEHAFTTEMSTSLQIPPTRIEITTIKRGSIVVYFQVLPASRVGERTLNEIVELLQDELGNATSTLRSKGTFARRVEPNGVKLSFSLADLTVAGGAEDISILGLIGTVLVLCFFVTIFGWCLRKRYERIMKHKMELEDSTKFVLDASQTKMKRMGIRNMT